MKKIFSKSLDFLWFIVAGGFVNIFLPSLPVIIVWGFGCKLIGSVEWNEMDFFTDAILVATGVSLAGFLFLYRKSKNWESNWKLAPIAVTILEYAFCIFLFLLICSKDGLSNPELRRMLDKNVELIHKLMWINTIILLIVLIFVIIFYFIDCYKKEKENEATE